MKKQALFTLSLGLLAGVASAQSLQTGYITWPGSSEFPSYVTKWKNNGYTLASELEDENFFISRVKPKARFRNSATQVNTSLTKSNDKRLCFWVPLTTSYEGQFNLNALPNSDFDSEVFSMWSYVDVFGNWTSPHGWAPGGFADVAHKNGVSVSGVASIPYGSINSTWSASLASQASLASEDIAKFLYAHGVDGLGYNSEFSGYSVQTIAKQHGEIISWLEAKGHPCAENIWYDGTAYSSASIVFDGSLSTHNYGNFADDSGNRRASLFLNYNWTSLLSSATTYAQTKGVDPLYLYAGMNMQGGEPQSGTTYPTLQSYPISLGYWGAHQFNMFWNARTARGSSKLASQGTYLYDTERFFTNGAQNPAVDFAVYTRRNHYPEDNFFGMSKFMTARSTLCWDLADEPFISYFNLGNGQFFNWKGEKQNSNGWYNIGVQDYLPNWRYWWAPTLLGRSVEKGNGGMKATFTWDDAYMGGSCLQITGTTTEQYLHLFKTQFELKTGDVITVRYKLRQGTTDMKLAMTLVGAESTAVRESNLQVIKADQAEDTEDWQEATFTISGVLTAGFNNKQVALMALHFENANNIDLLLGEVSIKRAQAATPAAPIITKAKLLGNHYQGVDGKLIFNMAHSKAAGEPVYNTDVNTSLFKLYAREEGGEPVLMGITTSWAGMFYKCPFDPMVDKKVQFGVSALSLDHNSESEITWSDLFAKSSVTYSVTDEIAITQTTIKPKEGFSIGYVDPKHTESTWTIYKSGVKVASHTGQSITFEDGNGLEEVGGYDLVIDEGTTGERRYNYYIQVSSWGVGALPRITAVTMDGKTVTSDDESVKLTLVDNVNATEPKVVGYTGREANGAASRGIEFNERFIGCKVSDLGLASGQSFSVAFWVNYTEFPDKTWALLDITNRGGTWPVSNWGFCWLRAQGQSGSAGHIDSYTFRGYSSDGKSPGELKYSFADTKFEAGTWAHVVITFDYATTTSFRSHLYINGVKQSSTWSRGTGGSGTGTTDTYATKNYQVQSTDWLSIGGLPYQGNAINGIVDDFQVWGKAMTADDVAKSMAGLDRTNLPSEVICFWDFEEDAASDKSFASYGSKAGVKLYNYNCEGGSNEGQGYQTPYDATVTSGCPFIAGTSYPVTTTPTWSAKKLVVSDAQGTDTEGQAKVSFTKEGDYTLTLSLANSYGKSTATYPVFSVTGATGIGSVADSDIDVYTVSEGLFVNLTEAGDYVISVYNAQGQLAVQTGERTAGNQLMHIALHNPGAYVVKVIKDGQVVRTVKVLK